LRNNGRDSEALVEAIFGVGGVALEDEEDAKCLERGRGGADAAVLGSGVEEDGL
jgi:hypothetical protein